MAAHSIDTKWENNWDPKSLPLHGLYPVKSEKKTQNGKILGTQNYYVYVH